MSSNTVSSPLIVAMDFDSPDDCIALAKRLQPKQCRLKIGKELFTVAGPKMIEQLASLGFEIFLDLKFHDIPNTVAKAVTAAANLGVWMVNIHALGGLRMMNAAREALDKVQGNRPLLIGVTILTSLTAEDLKGVGFELDSTSHVLRLASLANQAGMDGVVCSAHEAPELKAELGQSFLLVTPGIRLSDSASDDQKRVMTPKAALAAGSNFLVVGRPITQALDPVLICQQILQDVQ